MVVKNVGNNPLVLWKKVKVTAELTGTVSEPECTDQSLTYNVSGCTGSGTDDNSISKVINYAMTVNSTALVNSTWGVKVADVNDLWIPLGKVAVGETLTIAQNYHLDEATPNKYQGDEMNYDVTFYAEQVNAPGPAHTIRGVVLENKNTSGGWEPIINDGRWGILTWDTAGVYTAKVWGMNSGTYKLVYWNESTSGPEVSIDGTQTGTSFTFSGTYAGFNSNTNAKYWVRPNVWTSSSDVNTLYEANLVH